MKLTLPLITLFFLQLVVCNDTNYKFNGTQSIELNENGTDIAANQTWLGKEESQISNATLLEEMKNDEMVMMREHENNNDTKSEIQVLKSMELEVVKSVVQGYTQDYKSPIYIEDYAHIAEKIRERLLKNGPESYYWHVLVTPTNSSYVTNFFYCPDDYCHLILDQGWADIMITRGLKAEKTQKHVKEIILNTNSTVEEQISAYNFISKVKDVCSSWKDGKDIIKEFPNGKSMAFVQTISSQDCRVPTTVVLSANKATYYDGCDRMRKDRYHYNTCWHVVIFDGFYDTYN